LVDTRLVGGLGTAAIAGVGLATVAMYLCYSVVFGLMRGVKVRTAYAVGRGAPHDATRYAQAGAAMGVAAGVVVWVLARDISPALRLIGVEAATIAYARDFLAARTYGAVATCALTALIQHRQGLGDSRTPMLVGLAGNVVNAVLAWALIYGRLGLPALGVRGAGYGTAVAEALELAVLLVILARDVRRARGVPAAARVSLRDAVREVASLGLPTGAHFGLETLAFSAMTVVLGKIAARELAAHHTALNVVRASFLPGFAVSEAASVLVGQALARGDVRAADRVVRASLGLAMGFMTACGVVFAAAGGGIARAFAPDPAVVVVMRRLLLVAAVFQSLDAANMVLRGALRGAKDVRWVAVVGTIVVWCCLPGTALVLGRWAGWGAVGGWCGFVIETAAGSGLLWWRWSRGPWRVGFVPAPPVAPLVARTA
jgi:MATE family multidrug resistance protein